MSITGTKLLPLAKPFLELKEAQATWHPESKSWSINETHLGNIKAFLDALPELLEGSASKSITTPNRATVHQISTTDKRLLGLLINDDSTSTNYTSLVIEGKRAKVIDVPEQKEAILKRLDLEYRFLKNKGFTLRLGDLVRYEEEKDEDCNNDGTSIVGVTGLITLTHGIYNVGILPREFTSPYPYPINHWTGLLHAECNLAGIEGTINVWPFHFIDTTYVLEPEPLGPPIVDNGDMAELVDRYCAAIQFTYQGVTYSIYRFNGKAIPTEEEILETLVAPRTVFYAWSDTKMICV